MYAPKEFSTIVRGVMNKDGYVDVDLPSPLRTDQRYERLAVAVKTAHIPLAKNAGLYRDRPWGDVEEEGVEMENSEREGLKLWLKETWVRDVHPPPAADSDDPVQETGVWTYNSCGEVLAPSRHFEDNASLMHYLLSNLRPYHRAERDLPEEHKRPGVDDQEQIEDGMLPSCHINPVQWIELVENGKWLCMRQRAGIEEEMYGSEWANLFAVEMRITLSKTLAARLGVPQDRYLIRPTIMKRVSRGMGDHPLLHLCMDGASDSAVNDLRLPVLHTYLEGDGRVEPTRLKYVVLKDSFNTGDQSERKQLRLWVEGESVDAASSHLGEPVRKFLDGTGRSPAEISLELQWRRIILRSTARSVEGSR